MRSIAVYFVQRCYGGPEEGEWWYDAGTLCVEPELVACGATAASETEAVIVAKRIQQVLDQDCNVGDHGRPLDSVLSAGRYEAHCFEGWPPLHFPDERPRYE